MRKNICDEWGNLSYIKKSWDLSHLFYYVGYFVDIL